MTQWSSAGSSSPSGRNSMRSVHGSSARKLPRTPCRSAAEERRWVDGHLLHPCQPLFALDRQRLQQHCGAAARHGGDPPYRHPDRPDGWRETSRPPPTGEPSGSFAWCRPSRMAQARVSVGGAVMMPQSGSRVTFKPASRGAQRGRAPYPASLEVRQSVSSPLQRVDKVFLRPNSGAG